MTDRDVDGFDAAALVEMEDALDLAKVDGLAARTPKAPLKRATQDRLKKIRRKTNKRRRRHFLATKDKSFIHDYTRRNNEPHVPFAAIPGSGSKLLETPIVHVDSEGESRANRDSARRKQSSQELQGPSVNQLLHHHQHQQAGEQRYRQSVRRVE
jgi:hypothetical protein